ncbi:DNA primase [Patescibacteria group bacterium]|nr:DNA primase [Patescibacteria group bacterium]
MTSPVEEIKNRLDIVETVSSYINLQQVGGNFKAVCPFHNEKTPSFMVSKEKQIWHCFGCDKGGDVISFVQEYEGIDFKEAVRILAERANVALTGFSNIVTKDNSRIYQVNQAAADFYHNILEQDGQVSDKVKDYLDKRKIDKGSISKWKLGLSGELWDGLYKYLIENGYSEKEMFDAGLIVKKKDNSGYVDRFRKRLMFPLFDSQGRVVAFTSRTLAGIAYDEIEQGGKYINSPQTIVYDKSRLLYGWHLAKDTIRNKKYLIIVEGNMDVIASHQTSAKNCVAVSGTALTIDHIKLIKRYSNNIILAFDGDAAGSRASFRSIALCWQEDMNVKILVLPKGKDPADMVKDSDNAWLSAIKESIPVMDYYFKRIFSAIDLNRADHKKLAVNKLLPIIKYLGSNVEQAHYLKILSDKLQLPFDMLKNDLDQAKSFLEKTETTVVAATPKRKDQILMLSEELLAIAFYKKEYLEKLIADLEPEFIAESLRPLYKKVIIYYTKHQNLGNFANFSEIEQLEKDDWIKLSLWGEKNYNESDQSDLANDFQQLLNRVKKLYLESQRAELINNLRQSELVKDKAKQDEISHKINLINREINNLQS